MNKQSNKAKILLAEDDEAMRRFLEVILRRAGYAVYATEDGAQALQTALEKPFDMGVFDATMPNLSGYDLCRFLKQHPEHSAKPLIILSGKEAEIGVEADAYLLKTADLRHELLELVARLLQSQ
jgi:DNA-binding response OmpR family regulator